MLAEIYIRNFAIIEELRLPFVTGFNVLTGETGAGKSIILDAMMLILGGRADKSLVRANTRKAIIEATFLLDDERRATLAPILEAEGLDGDAEDELMIIREVRANGRTVARINGSLVGIKLLQQVGEYLIDIHGQGSHLKLLQSRSHLPLLDSYANVEVERARVAAEVRQIRALQSELADLQRDDRLLAQRVDLLSFQVQEIDAANLQPDEEDGLQAERKRLGNAEQLMQSSATVSALLLGVDDETPAVLDLLGSAERTLGQLARLDDTQEMLLERVQGLVSELNELAADVDDYKDSLEFNPERLNEVEERLELIHGLKRKYGDSIEAILAHRDDAAIELDKIERSEERSEELYVEIDKYLRKIGSVSAELSRKRQAAATRIAQTVESELRDLAMNARFTVRFQRVPDPNGVYVGNERFAFDPSGIDKAEFLLSTNPGEPLKPMAKVASGGETARIMLALKTALARVDDTPTLIFDEIDQGIGGRIGDTVGRKLWGLTSLSEHQVIVVTHLPQLAGYGDKHYHVRKQVVDGRTRTRVTELDYQTRVNELAAMIGTATKHAVGGAAAILDNASQVKQGLI